MQTVRLKAGFQPVNSSYNSQGTIPQAMFFKVFLIRIGNFVRIKAESLEEHNTGHRPVNNHSTGLQAESLRLL
ncbi:MAG: hypothetical protein MI922_26535 [Bacteroidales bacterium]|nr:hypothetical protein [Bacteroidales bacterium]